MKLHVAVLTDELPMIMGEGVGGGNYTGMTGTIVAVHTSAKCVKQAQVQDKMEESLHFITFVLKILNGRVPSNIAFSFTGLFSRLIKGGSVPLFYCT